MQPFGTGGVMTDGQGNYFDAQGNPITAVSGQTGVYSNGQGQTWDGSGNPLNAGGSGGDLRSLALNTNGSVAAPTTTQQPPTDVGTGQAGPYSPGGTLAGPTTTSGVTPYSPTAAPTPTSVGTPSPYTPTSFTPQVWTPPAAFQAPTAAQAAAQPGYQFSFDQGQKALEQSAAARGLLNSGGTLQDLVNYGQNAATQNYGNVYNEMLGTYNTNTANQFQAFQTNTSDAYNAWLSDQTNRQSAANINNPQALAAIQTNNQNLYNQWAGTQASNANAYGMNFNNALATNQNNFGQSQTSWQDALAAYGMNYQTQTLDPFNMAMQGAQFNNTNDFNKWLQQYNIYAGQNQFAYNALYGLSNLGLNAGTAS